MNGRSDIHTPEYKNIRCSPDSVKPSGDSKPDNAANACSASNSSTQEETRNKFQILIYSIVKR